MEAGKQPRRRKASATTHHEPYPARLHRHLTGAADALQALAAVPEADAGLETPEGFASRYGAADAAGEDKNG